MKYMWQRRLNNKAVIADGSQFAKTMVKEVANKSPRFWTDVDKKNAAMGIMLPPSTPIDAFRQLLDSVLLHEVN